MLKIVRIGMIGLAIQQKKIPWPEEVYVNSMWVTCKWGCRDMNQNYSAEAHSNWFLKYTFQWTWSRGHSWVSFHPVLVLLSMWKGHVSLYLLLVWNQPDLWKRFSMAAKSLAASLSVAAKDFGSLLTSSKTRPVSRFIEAPMIDNSIPMMADLYRGAGVGSLQGLEASVKANFYEAQVCGKYLPPYFPRCGRFAMPGRSS